MIQNKEQQVKEATYIKNRSWFIVFSVAFVFGIVWTIVGDSNMKIAFISIAFLFFLRYGVLTEASARELTPHH